MTRRPHRIDLPDHLSDESAAEILDFLYEMIRVFESRYFDHIRRHHDALRAEMREATDAQPLRGADPARSDTDPPF